MLFRSVGEQLVQNGLNLARDVRIAYADYASAIERLQLARDANRIRHEFADLTYKRFKDGDISELETITSRVDALSSDAAIAAEEYNVSIAKARLQTSMGIPSYAGNLVPNPLTTLPLPEIDDEELLQIALTCRPDYQGAQWLVSAAEERTRLARWQFLRFDGVADTRYNSDHVRTGTGLRFDLPLFNRNQGGVVRTDWELNAAAHNRDAIRDQIHQEVRVATQQTSQARSNLQIIENSVLPKLSEAITLAQKGFADGGTDYLLVLQTTTQYLDARSRLITERTNLQRAIAELERSISRPLSESPLEESWGESSGGSIAEPHNKSPER